jgi:outer membrane protein TolC
MRHVAKLILPLVLSLAGVCRSADAESEPAAAAPTTLDLAECLQLARERQPRLAAQRASLAAAEDGRRAVENLRFPATLDPEIPVRRKQAELGVAAAAAALDQAERDMVYAVTRTYYTVLYAREQERLAQGVVERLSTIRRAAQLQLEAGAEGITSADLSRTLVYLRLAETRRTQATQGVKRALAALREAAGVGPCAALDIPPGRLTEPEARPNQADVIAAALARRGDFIQASIFAQVVCLEIEAQGTSHHQRMQTFAAGSDLHARQVPEGTHNTDYRPGAVAPEMPTLLAGSRAERMKHAQDLHAKAEAIVETSRNLIALEAEDAFLLWEAAFQQAAQAREAAEAGDQLADGLTRDFNARLKVTVPDVVSARVLASQARSQYNEFLYREILALADLERITAGGFCAGLTAAATRQAPPAPEAESKGK